METKIKKGQLWTVIDDHNGKILIIDLDKKNEIVHFAYMKNNEVVIFHIPIDYSLFIQSIIEHIGEMEISREFFDAKKIWKDHAGGVWKITIKEIVDLTLQGN